MAHQKGAPKTGGRVRGTPNKTPHAVAALARSYGPAVILELARLAFHAESAAVQVAAIKELLNRGFGKAPMPAVDEAGPQRVIVTFGAREPGEPMPDPLAVLPPREPRRLIGPPQRPFGGPRFP
jgi:hypothetical protein